MRYSKQLMLILYLIMSLCLLGCSNKYELVREIDNKIIKDINNNIEVEKNVNNKTTSLNNIEENNETIEPVQTEKDKIIEVVNSEKTNISILVNKDNQLDSSYKPSDLVKPNVKSSKSNILIRDICVNDLENMFNDAKEDNIILSLISGFRSYDYQEKIYNNSVKHNGIEYTSLYVAKPGYSEHQTGLAVDISSASNYFKLTDNFANTKEGNWLKENAHKYGFILRYRDDRISDTGYGFEPWHFRYVGTEIATYIYKNNLILEDLFLKD